MVTASASSAAASVRGGGEAVDARCPGPQFHAAFEVDGPDDHVAARGEVGEQFVEPAALAGAGRAADDGVPAQEQHAARFGVLERSQVDRLGDRGDRWAVPRDRVGVRVVVQDAQLAAVGEVIGGRVDADRVAVRAEPRFERGDLRHHVGDGLAAGQAEPGAPPPQVHRGGHDLRAGQADRPGDVRPGRDGPCDADFRAAPAVGPPRDRQHQPADAERLRERRGERTHRGRHRVPGAAREHRHGHVEPFQPRGDAEPRAERGEHPRGDTGNGEDERPPRRQRAVRVPSERRDEAGDAEGREFAAVAPRPPGDDHGGEFGERVTGADDHHGLHARASGLAGVAAHPPVAGHDALPWRWAGIWRAFSSSRR